MTEPLNPVQVEQAIDETRNRIANGVKVVTSAERKAQAKRREFDRAYAVAYMKADGPAHEKKYQAVLDTMELRAEAEDAELEFKHAERTAWSLKDELSALQSIGSSVRAMYGSVRA